MLQRFLTLVQAAPDAPSLIDGESGAAIDRRSLAARAEQIAALMESRGIRSGDLVALQLPNSTDFVASVLAACRTGVVLAPVDRDAREGEIRKIVTQFAIRALLHASGGFPSLEVTPFAAGERPPLPRGSRLLKLTSGSTGTPKAIVCSEENLLADCDNICSSMGITPDSRNLGAIPFSHSYGFSNLVTPLLAHGVPVVVSNDYLPLSLLEMANRHRCTVAPLIPMVFEHLAGLPESDGRFETIRTFISAGAPLQASTSRRFRERFGLPIHSFYGCSECGGITYDRAGSSAERGTVGTAMDGVSLSIHRNRRLAVKSSSVALGYLVDARTFTPFEAGTFVTEDLSEVQDGEIALRGRLGDLINTAGKKVNPREVEQVLLQIDGVREAKVYGEPAGARGDVVAAAIVGNPGLTREQVRAYCRERLSAHKVPRIVKLIDAIPLDERGKVKRALLASL